MKKLDLSFGFEIEGLFSQKLYDKLETDFGGKVNSSGDGSVSFGNEQFVKIINPIDEKEVKVGIFHSVEDLSRCLGYFINGKNYLNNETCGLHLHIGIKDNSPLGGPNGHGKIFTIKRNGQKI